LKVLMLVKYYDEDYITSNKLSYSIVIAIANMTAIAPMAPFPDPPTACTAPALCVWFAAVALALPEVDAEVLPVLVAELEDLPLVDVAILLEVEDEPPGAAATPVELVDKPLEVEDAVTEEVGVADCWPEAAAPAVMTTGTKLISDAARVVVDTAGMLAAEPIAESTQTAEVLPETAQPLSMVLFPVSWASTLGNGEVQVLRGN